MTLKLMGRKRGMIQQFDVSGNIVVCTVIQAEPNVITQIKTEENDGYQAVQMGFEKVVAKDPRRQLERVSKPLRGHFAKGGVEPRRHLEETRVKDSSVHQVGQEFGVDLFEDITYVDVQSVSKGKGYQGVMKLHGFGGGPAAHGSGFHRHAGSTGMRSTPGRCLPGGKRASRMGGDVTTVENLKVVMIDKEKNLLLVKGSVPGACGALVTVSSATKKSSSKKK
ncbi:MAG: 50S ribosomal protein L3 [Chlamydiales bacterium]|nr:50S ribosomal protein L3 [Chlamydiales bacterium]